MTTDKDKEISDNAALFFAEQFSSIKHGSTKSRERDDRIVEEKSALLIPIRMMLKKLMDAEVYVTNNAVHDTSLRTKTYAPKKLDVWEAQSSPTWIPGGSIFLDHPAQLEIAVTNHTKKEKNKKIIISCVDDHPKKYLFQSSFDTPELACKALAEFLSHSTVDIKRPEILLGQETKPDKTLLENNTSAVGSKQTDIPYQDYDDL